MKIKIPKIEYVEKEVYSKDYEEVIKGIKTLKDLGFDVRYEEILDEKGWEIRVYIQPGGLCGHIHKGTWEERHVYNVVSMPIWSSRSDVEPIISDIYASIAKYGRLTVVDLYDIISSFEPTFEVVCVYTDNKYGWTRVSQVRVIHTRDGYTIGLDEPESFD